MGWNQLRGRRAGDKRLRFRPRFRALHIETTDNLPSVCRPAIVERWCESYRRHHVC